MKHTLATEEPPYPEFLLLHTERDIARLELRRAKLTQGIRNAESEDGARSMQKLLDGATRQLRKAKADQSKLQKLISNPRPLAARFLRALTQETRDALSRLPDSNDSLSGIKTL